jgi:hypothetical protein
MPIVKFVAFPVNPVIPVHNAGFAKICYGFCVAGTGFVECNLVVKRHIATSGNQHSVMMPKC